MRLSLTWGILYFTLWTYKTEGGVWMDIQQLRYYIAAAESCNFSKAAKDCFVVQSTISKQISLLEDELKVSLFSRGKKGLSLTDEGLFLLGEARKIVALADRTTEHIEGMRGEREKTIKVGYYATGIGVDTGHLVNSFYSQQHIKVEMLSSSIVHGDLLEYLDNGALDLVITLDPPNKSSYHFLKYYTLKPVKMKLVASRQHPLLSGLSQISLEELKSLNEEILILRPEDADSVVKQGKSWLQKELLFDLDRINFTTDLLSMMIQIDSRMSIGLVLETELSCLNTDNLIMLDVSGIEPMNICLALNRKNASPETILFLNSIQSFYAGME